MADTKISLLTQITSPQDPTKMYVPLFAQDGTPLNARMNFSEIFKTPVQMNLNATVANSAVIFSTPADGRLLLTDYAGTSFGRLQLGGITAAYPSLKRNATGVDFRLADDSEYAPIAAGKTAISNSAIAGNGEILTLTTSFGTASLRVGTGGLFTVGGDIAAVGSASLISSSAHLKFGTGSDAGIAYASTAALRVSDGSTGLGALTMGGASITPAWSGTGTATTPLLVNVTADPGPANAASKLLDLQVVGSSKSYFRKDGSLQISPASTGAAVLQFGSDTVTGFGQAAVNLISFYDSNGSEKFRFSNGNYIYCFSRFSINQAIEITEMSEPGAPDANKALLYCRDNGSSKTQLCVRFNTGAVAVLATEP